MKSLPDSHPNKDYIALKNHLGIPKNEKKNTHNIIYLILKIIINTNVFKARLPIKKLARTIKITTYTMF